MLRRGRRGRDRLHHKTLFSILFIVYSRNTGNSFWVYWAPFFLAAGAMLLGIPVYMAQRRHLTRPPSVPPYPQTGSNPHRVRRRHSAQLDAVSTGAVPGLLRN